MYWLIAVIAIFGIGALSGWQGRGHWDAGEINDIKLEVAQREAAAVALVNEEKKRSEEWAGRFEAKLANLRIVNRTINNEVRRETEKTVYTDCVVPESGVLLIRRSIDQANAAAAGIVPPEVPADTKPAGKGNDGRSVQPR
jgi:hypothetical protein